MAGNLNWYGDERLRDIRGEFTRRLKAGGMLVRGQAVRLLSVAGTGTRTKDGQVVQAQKSGKKRVYGAFPSKPGEPPRKQTGVLRGSVDIEVDERKLTARVGTNIEYGRHLELGTNIMAPRPWLRRALAEVQAQVRAILSRPMR